MNTSEFAIQSIFYDILTNGFRNDINDNPERIGFILGAIDCGFAISKPGSIKAKKGLVEIYLVQKSDGSLKVVIFKKEERQAEMDYSPQGFMWYKVKTEKGRLFIEDSEGKYGLICSIN